MKNLTPKTTDVPAISENPVIELMPIDDEELATVSGGARDYGWQGGGWILRPGNGSFGTGSGVRG